MDLRHMSLFSAIKLVKSYNRYRDTQGKVMPLANAGKQNIVLNVKEKEISEAKREITKEMY